MALSLEEKQKVSELKQKGYSNTQIMGYIASTRRGMQSAISEELGETPSKEVQNELSYGQRVIDANSSKLAQRVEQFGASANRYASGEQGLAETAVQQTGTALAAGVVDPTTSIVENIPGAKPVLGAVGKGINALATSKYSPIKYIGDFFGNSEKLQEAVRLYDTDPQFKQTVDSTANILNAAATLEGGVRLGTGTVNQSIKAGQQGLNAAKPVIESLTRTADDAYRSGTSLAQRTKDTITGKISGKNIDPQLQTSVERITQPTRFLEGTAQRVDDPIKLYDDYLTQSKQALTDTKIDPAIARIGSEIGDEFKNVVKQRQQVGQIMGNELKKFGSQTVDMKNPVGQFQQELIGSGATYDALTNTVKAGNTSKFTTTDIKLLQQYADDIKALGTNPTAAELDAFISRIPREIKELRTGSGINTMTNAERIISTNLNQMREAFRPVATPEYLAARQTYSDLSSFINEGSSYLGKITQSGDFAKDASLAKSSVQSILNNGKKDWLIELEALSGNPLLDKSVLALQAMKDAGDFRGTSLLEVLNDGAVPTSKAGMTQKFIDFTLGKAGEAISGSPEEQTRRFLIELMQQQ